jgi:hypothetical protein
MTFVQIVGAILADAAITAVFLTVLGYLGRSIIERWISRDLEKYKAELQVTNARELEKLRADLRLTAFEYEIRFAKLHEKQAEVIAKFYELLVIANEQIYEMGSITVSDEESSLSFKEIVQTRTNRAFEAFDALIKFYNRNRLYFEEQTRTKIDGLLHALQDTLMDFAVAAPDPQTHEKRWHEAHRSISERIPVILEVAEADFREILGYKVSAR